jgi:hypothetical protein
MPLTATPAIRDAMNVDQTLSSRSAIQSAAVPAITAMITEAATSPGL